MIRPVLTHSSVLSVLGDPSSPLTFDKVYLNTRKIGYLVPFGSPPPPKFKVLLHPSSKVGVFCLTLLRSTSVSLVHPPKRHPFSIYDLDFLFIIIIVVVLLRVNSRMVSGP